MPTYSRMSARVDDLHRAADMLERQRATAQYAPPLRHAAAELARPLSDDAAALLADWIEQAGELWHQHPHPARVARALGELRGLIADAQAHA
jgi:hypothetical protein